MPTRTLAFYILVAALPLQVLGQTQDTICLEHVNVIPMTEEVVLRNQRVVIASGKIITVESATRPRHISAALVLDGTGKYLVPGFSEMHYHFRSKDLKSDFKLLAANGIITVRNMAEPDGQTLAAVRRGTASGELLALNYFTTGPYLTSRDLSSPKEIEPMVHLHKEKGYDFVKIADNLPLPTYLKLLEACQTHNIPLIGHAQRTLPLEFSLRMKSVEHVEEFVYLSDTQNTPFVKQGAPAMEKLAQQVKASGAYVGTTLVGFEFINQCLNDNKFSQLQHSNSVKYLAKAERESFLTEKNDYRKLKNQTFEGVQAPDLFASYAVWMNNFVRILAEAGVPLLTGSDTYGMVIVGFSLHREFALLQSAGMRPYDILLASTVTPARYLNTIATEGTITVGKNANLILLEKNPLENIKNTTTIAGVLLQGKWLDRKQLNQLLTEVEAAYK